MEISILTSVLAGLPWKKGTHQPRSTILRDFQNQKYGFTIPKSRTQLVEKEKEKAKNTGNCKTLCVSREHNNDTFFS